MKIEERNEMIEKSNTKKDGVYSHKGILYAVKDKKAIAFCDYFGNVFRGMGVFNVSMGKVERWDRRKTLTRFLKEI